MGKLTKRQRRLAAVLTIGVLVILGWLIMRDSDEQSAEAEIETAVQQALADARQEPPAAAVVYDIIAPSIVVIEAQGGSREADGSGLGTGVIVNADGSILTALHVVGDADEIMVTYSDGTTTRASVVASVQSNLSVPSGASL